MNKVIVYSTTTCGYCKAVKRFFDDKGVAYEDKNIQVDREAYQELEAKIGGRVTGVPVTDFNGEIVRGFNRPRLEQLVDDR